MSVPVAQALTAPWNVRLRVRRWLAARLPRTDTQLLTQGNIYILPTRAGWMFALTLVVLLLASVNYQLNLATSSRSCSPAAASSRCTSRTPRCAG